MILYIYWFAIYICSVLYTVVVVYVYCVYDYLLRYSTISTIHTCIHYTACYI